MTKLANEYIPTYSGKRIDPEAPSSKLITAEDIFFSLSNIMRYNGHTHISVLRHSIAVSCLAEDSGLKPALYGLLHDASEAYLGDVTTALRCTLNGRYEQLTKRFDTSIYLAIAPELISLSPEDASIVKKLDKQVVEYEMTIAPSIAGGGMYYPDPVSLTNAQFQKIDDAYYWSVGDKFLPNFAQRVLRELRSGIAR